MELSSHRLILANVSRHIQLGAEEEEYFLSLLTVKSFKKKEYLLKQGEVCRSDYFVTGGCLRVYTIDDEGMEHIAMFAPADWWTSDLYSFITQQPSRYFVDALEDTEVLAISKDGMEELLQKVPKFERFFRIVFQKAYVANEERIVQNLSNTAQERYEAFKLRYPGLEQRIAQKHVAAYLGITPEFLSMMRRKEAGR